MRAMLLTLIALLACLATNSDISASEPDTHVHHYHTNSLYGFIGITGKDRRERAGTVAIEYERRFNEKWGLAAGLEHAFGDLDFTVFTVPVVFHKGKWIIYAGPGLERHHGHDEFLFRMGGGYEFEKGNLILVPKISVDVVDGEAIFVGGLAVGIGF